MTKSTRTSTQAQKGEVRSSYRSPVQSSEQEAYHRAKKAFSKAGTKNYASIHD